jgi:hypothetical protein
LRESTLSRQLRVSLAFHAYQLRWKQENEFKKSTEEENFAAQMFDTRDANACIFIRRVHEL